MNLKRVLVSAGIAVLLATAGSIADLGSASRTEGHLDGARLMDGLRAYTRDQKARNTQPPAAVSLEELIRGGWVRESDVSALRGMRVTFDPSADEGRPGGTLVTARTPDGQTLVLLSDGSVQYRR